jgi:hypothetical protein
MQHDAHVLAYRFAQRRIAQRAARVANPWMPINPFDSAEDQAAQRAARKR